ncbi:hypothetical protein MDAP_000079 [Mitosporidium daphniae]
MNTMKALITLALMLLAHTVVGRKLDFKDFCQFTADDFTPQVFEGQTPKIANEAINTIFSFSKENLLKKEYGISSGVYEKIMHTIKQVSNFDPSDVYQKIKNLKILPSNTDLKAFGNETNSVVFYCGLSGHAMLCEIFKVASPDPKHEYLWKVLIYNSGDELEYHPLYIVGPKAKYSPVVIYEGIPILINEAWVKTAMYFYRYTKDIKNFYLRLLADFDRSNATYDVFIYRQRTETSDFSSYHAYFTFKLDAYNKIFGVASLSGLQHFASENFSNIISKSHLSRYKLFLVFPSILLPFYKIMYQIANMFPFKFVATLVVLAQSYLTEWAIKFFALIPFISKETRESIGSLNQHTLASYTNVLNNIGKFHFLRSNVDLADKMFAYLVEIGNGMFETKEHIFFKDLKVAYDQFQIFKNKNSFDTVPTQIADNRDIRASFSCPDWTPFWLGSHDKLSVNDTFYCELPNFEYADGAYDPLNFTEFSNSIFHFLNNELAYQPCFMGEKIPLLSYLDSLTFRVTQMVETFDSSNVEKMGFLYAFSMKILALLDYSEKKDIMMYQKALILVEIFDTYKKIYRRYLKSSLNNDENKFKLINTSFFAHLSPEFLYLNEMDLLGRNLPREHKGIYFAPKDQEITSKLVSILFKDRKDLPKPDEMKSFLDLYLLDREDYLEDYDPHHFKSIAYILTVIGNPVNIENSNNTVIPETFLLDRHYYNLLHMFYKILNKNHSPYVYRINAPSYFYTTADDSEDSFIQPGDYNNLKEIQSISGKEKRPLRLLNLEKKFASVFYLLNHLQEDHAFILSEAGMNIIYRFILQPSTYTNDYDTKRALPLLIQYFLSQKMKILGEVSTYKDDDTELFRLLANYQVILNHLMSLQTIKPSIDDLGDLEKVFVGKFDAIFAFLKLNTLILGEKFSNLSNSHDLYLSVISNFELIKTFFFRNEIQYVLKMYYDYWKFPSSKSRCAKETDKGIQNLVNGNLLIDGERTTLPGLPFPNHPLWKIMNVKENRNSNVEYSLHKRRSDNSIFSILKCNYINVVLQENNAFLVKNGEVEAKLVSGELKLCHSHLDLEISFNSKMVGSDHALIVFGTCYKSCHSVFYIFDADGFLYGRIYGRNTLVLENSSRFVGNVSSPLPCSFRIKSFCSFSSISQSVLGAFLARGALFNFAMDSYIFILESEDQSFYFFDSHNGTAKDFYVMKEGRDDYFAVINGEKFKIHLPGSIKENFFASSNFPFLFVSIEKYFQIIIPVPLSKPGESYNFTFVKTTCNDDHFNIEGHDREIELAIVYWLVFLRYYDRAMEYVSLYSSVSLQLTEIELVILRNIIEIKYRDLEYLVIKTWAKHLLGEHEIFFKGFLDETNRIENITEIANLISVIPFKYKRVLFSFLPNIGEDKYFWAYSKRLEIVRSDRKSSKLKPNIKRLDNDIVKIHSESYKDIFLQSEPIDWSKFESFRLPSYLHFLYDLAGSSKDLTDFTSKLNSRYLDFIRFYLEIEKDKTNYEIICLFHVIFMIFNKLPDKKKLATFFAQFKNKKFPRNLLNIYDESVELKSFIPYEKSISISAILPSRPEDYENLLKITMQRNALSSVLFKASASFTLFSDVASVEQKLKSIVSTDELLYGFPLRALKDPRLLAQILLCGSVEELRAFFIVSAEKTPELLDLLWSHFIRFFYCESRHLKNTIFCQTCVQKKEPSTQQSGDVPDQQLVVTVHQKVFILIEFFTGFPLYEEQKAIISNILNETMHGNSYVVQQGMAGGKTTRFGPAAAILATSILRKLPIFVFPNSILNQNILQLRQWLFDFFGKGVFEFKAERSLYGYSESYLRHLYYRLTMAHHRGDAFVSSINSIQCLLNAIKELYLQNTDASKRSFVWVVRILYFIKYYSIFVGDEVDEIIDLSILYNFDTDELDEKNWVFIDLLIECFLSLRGKKIFKSQTGEDITIFEIKEPLTPSTTESFKNTLKKELNDILSKTSNETRTLIVDHLFVNCWEKIRNVGYGASMKSPLPYPIPYSMANTPREGSSFGNQMFIIAISLKFYFENEMKDLSEPPLFFTEENIYSALRIYYKSKELKKIKRTQKPTHLQFFNRLRDKIYQDDENFKKFFKEIVIESLKTSPHQLVSSAIDVFSGCLFIGYSGTLYNFKNFDRMPNLKINVDQSSVIEKKIYYSFAFPPPNCYTKDYPEIYDYAAVTKGLGILKDHQFNTLMDFIFKNSTTALFDVGALLKDYSNSKVAQDILASKKYKCVVYYDDKQNVIVYQMNTGRVGRDLPVEGQFEFLQTKHNLKNDEIFLYLDQPHCFGTNVDVNNSSAICVVTFSTLVYTKSFYQALLRARKLLNGISDTIPLTPPNDARHQIRFFVSSFLKHDQAMLSALSQEERETLSSKPKIFPEDVPGDEKVTLQRIFTSAHLNQFRRDRKEQSLLPWQHFFSTVSKILWSPSNPESNQIPNWDKLLKPNNRRLIDELKWIFFCESKPKKQIEEVFKDSEVGRTFFPNFNISLIPSISNTRPTLDRETVVQSTQEQESVQEQEQIHEKLEDINVLPAYSSHFGISNAVLDSLRVNFTKDFAKTAVGPLNLNDTYTKYPVFVDIFKGKKLFATPNDVSEKLKDPSHFFFSPALINIYDLKEFDLEDMLHYLAYSGGAVGFMDLLDSCTKADEDFIFSFMAAHQLILQEWIYFARKFKRPSSLELLRNVQWQFKRGGTKYDFTNVAIKASIVGRNLTILGICPKDSKKPLNLDKLNFKLPFDNEKNCKAIKV